MPSFRLAFIVMFMVQAIIVLAIGDARPWIDAVMSYGGGGALSASIGPPRWFGYWWLIVGIPLGVWLFSRGRLGLAGLAVSPYWLPIYLLAGLFEVTSKRSEIATRERQRL
jgi:hypothetical protein